MKIQFDLDGKIFDATVETSYGDSFTVTIGENTFEIKKPFTNIGLLFKEGKDLFEIATVNKSESEFVVFVNKIPHNVSLKEMHAMENNGASQKQNAENDIFSPLFGIVSQVFVSDGQRAKKGQRLVSVISMKMENNVLAPKDGEIEKVLVLKGQKVSERQLLVKMR